LYFSSDLNFVKHKTFKPLSDKILLSMTRKFRNVPVRSFAWWTKSSKCAVLWKIIKNPASCNYYRYIIIFFWIFWSNINPNHTIIDAFCIYRRQGWFGNNVCGIFFVRHRGATYSNQKISCWRISVNASSVNMWYILREHKISYHFTTNNNTASR